MKKTEPLSSRPVQNPASFHRSADSSSLESRGSQAASYPLPLPVQTLNERIPRLRDEDLARWGAMVIEDIGIFEIDRIVGTAADFGASIRRELCGPSGGLNPHWCEVASRVFVHSPGASDPTFLLGTLCLLATAKIYEQGGFDAAR